MSLSHGRQLVGTDDVAIYLDDTLSEALASKLIAVDGRSADDVPCAIAMMSPARRSQQQPTSCTSVSKRLRGAALELHDAGGGGGLQDVTNMSTPRQSTKGGPLSSTVPGGGALSAERASSLERALLLPPSPFPSTGRAPSTASTPAARHRSDADGGGRADEVVTLSVADYERLQLELRRATAMYEHQKAIADAQVERHMEDYHKLQQKIHEVIGLASRHEESKRFIRQLKRELYDIKVRILPLQNGALQRSAVVDEKEIANLVQQRVEEQLLQIEGEYGQMLEEQAAHIKTLELMLKNTTGIELAAAQQPTSDTSTPGGTPGRSSDEEATTCRKPSMAVKQLLLRAFQMADGARRQAHLDRQLLLAETQRRHQTEQTLDEVRRELRESQAAVLQERQSCQRQSVDQLRYIQELQTALVDVI